MTPRNDWKELLIRYHSGELDVSKCEQVERELQRSPDLQRYREQLNELDQYLKQQSKVAQPSKNFTDKVMHGITLPVRSHTLSPKMGLLLLISVLTIATIAVIFLTNGFFDPYVIPLNVNLKALYFEKLPSLDFNFPFPSKWVVSAFLILNLAIGFVLLDRTILKPYFQRRAEEFSA
jgi:hypothetical protein